MSELSPRFRLAGGRFGVASRLHWWRALGGLGVLFGPGYALLRLFSVVGRRGPVRRGERSWALAAARLLGLRVDLLGLDHSRRGGPFVVLALHEGFADALALARLPLPLTYVARDELVDWRLLGGQLRRGGHLIVSPEGPWTASRRMIRQARVALDRGESVVVFPQGRSSASRSRSSRAPSR